MRKPRIIIISGPSGAGKTTLLSKLFRKKFFRNNFIKSISYTTRPRRSKERNGKDYCFVSKREFTALRQRKGFLEWQRVLDDYYGTPLRFYSLAQRQSKDLILCIDVKGGAYVQKHCARAGVVTVFISVPNKRELYRRLRKRAEERGTIKKRIQLAKKELQFIKDYDYLIINQNLDQSAKLLESILIAERLRRRQR